MNSKDKGDAKLMHERSGYEAIIACMKVKHDHEVSRLKDQLCWAADGLTDTKMSDEKGMQHCSQNTTMINIYHAFSHPFLLQI